MSKKKRGRPRKYHRGKAIKTGFSMSPAMMAWIKSRCRENKTTMSHVVREALVKMGAPAGEK